MKTDEDLIERVKKEINKTGFPLEIRIGNLLINRDYYVTHSKFYVDEEEGKSREIDIRAIKNYTFLDEDKKVFVRNSIHIECKKSDNKPWVFMSSDKTGSDPGLDDIFVFSRKRSVIPLSIIDKLQGVHPFSKKSNVARGYFEAFKGNETGEMIFKAITSSVKSSLYNRGIDEQYSNDIEDINFYYPLIVFEGNMFEATIINDDINVTEVDSVFISFLYESKFYERSNFIIPVLTPKALPGFLEELELSLMRIGDEIQSKYDMIKLLYENSED
ncbi:hypothetical protein [Paenibacillus sinopodophylli]|uniref:hypothetical protein n=1 Tax=Paenibacillus sinopodophylli TaxID=1837342 RepID=UPI00110CB182|nr:hypothetical protein [Paenibacillus sinopodophylli]